jgi:hypothetical protein
MRRSGRVDAVDDVRLRERRSGLVGHTAKVTVSSPAPAPRKPPTEWIATACRARSVSAAQATRARNSHEYRASRGIFLQSGWKVSFVYHEDYAGNDFTQVHVESVPKYQERYRGSSCWLSTARLSILCARRVDSYYRAPLTHDAAWLAWNGIVAKIEAHDVMSG